MEVKLGGPEEEKKDSVMAAVEGRGKKKIA